MSPQGIADLIGTDRFTISYRYLNSVPLTLIYCDDVEEDEPVTVRGEQDYVLCGPVLIFRHGNPIASLSDFEMLDIKESTELVKLKDDGRCVLELRGISKYPKPPKRRVVDG